MSSDYVLSLCDRTGNMVRPWARAGYICHAVDVQHDGVSVETVGYSETSGQYVYKTITPDTGGKEDNS